MKKKSNISMAVLTGIIMLIGFLLVVGFNNVSASTLPDGSSLSIIFSSLSANAGIHGSGLIDFIMAGNTAKVTGTSATVNGHPADTFTTVPTPWTVTTHSTWSLSSGGGSGDNVCVRANYLLYADNTAGFVEQCQTVPDATIAVKIDIKPGSFPNSINIKNDQTVTVALLGSSTFNVNTVDKSSLKFGGHTPASPIKTSLQDINGDSFMDLVSQYKVSSLGFNTLDTQGCLTGKLLVSGIPFQGCDSVRIFNK